MDEKNIKILSKYDNLVHKKAWGEEIWIHNDENYCGKILKFKHGSKFSMHFHVHKIETWYVNKGEFMLNHINTEDAEFKNIKLKEGDIIEIPRGVPHQLIAVTNAEIFEISTQHFENDSYRISKGDSQTA
jgi:mannose-6-phosphate isomerase-like protein (cupin superfamily)